MSRLETATDGQHFAIGFVLPLCHLSMVAALLLLPFAVVLCIGGRMERLCESSAKGWWRLIWTVIVAWIISAAVIVIVAFVGSFPSAQVLAVCGLWSFPFLLHILVLVLERRFWHYCERANSSAEHAQERFKTLLGTFEASLGMYVLNKNFV